MQGYKNGTNGCDRKHMERIRKQLMELIDFNTTMNSGNTKECARYIQMSMMYAGIQAKIFHTGSAKAPAHHVLAEIPGQSADTLLLHAHMDTAPYDKDRGWHVPPERAVIVRDCILGRGALDCKSQIAVWMRLMEDTAEKCKKGRKPEYSLKLLITDREESGGEDGLGELMKAHPELFSSVRLAIGEGGGFPFPFHGRLYYSFQTGEREDSGDDNELTGSGKEGSDGLPAKAATCSEEDQTAAENIRDSILKKGIKLGYYAPVILDYCREEESIRGRRLDTRPLYEGMEEYFQNAAPSIVWKKYGALFLTALQSEVADAELMPYITPGFSDNRWFRKNGIPVIGFFPLDPKNAVSGIHGPDEYISMMSLELAYKVMSKTVHALLYGGQTLK